MKKQLQRIHDQVIRQCFGAFLEKSFHTVSPAVRYLHNWHLEAIAAHLAACERGEITRLIINMPPRMLKSITVSVAWPAWLLAHQPSQRVMVASYAQLLSNKHSMDCRLVMQSPWYRRIFPHTVLSDDQNEKDKYVTTARGHRLAVSVGGAATGEGGNILIVDDPLNPLQAMQASARDAANAWFDHTFASRLDDKRNGVIVVVMQRLHTDDLSGYLLRKGGRTLLSLPAIAPQEEEIRCGNYVYRRGAGGLLHPQREDEKILARARSELGEANFSAQYQQAPIRSEGNMIRLAWFKRYD